MSAQEFRRALGYAATALELLKRATVPPYPQFYELMYTYATGVDPDLNTRINTAFREGKPDELAERLFNDFLRGDDTQERISSVSDRMSKRINLMHAALSSAATNAETYSGTLKVASDELGSELSPETLRTLAASLLEETQRMQTANAELEHSLDTARDDIAALRQDLDDMRQEAMLDPLTQVCNRKAFDEGLMHAMFEARETEKPLCLLMVDIDHFKNFNDTWGHQTGDRVLRLVAMTLKSNIKGRDIAARYGGEEFAAILPSTDLEGATILAENIRQAIQSKEVQKRSTKEKLGKITASIGVSQFHPPDSAASLIERADRCLYAAKNRGRNRVIIETEIDPDATAAA